MAYGGLPFVDMSSPVPGLAEVTEYETFMHCE